MAAKNVGTQAKKKKKNSARRKKNRILLFILEIVLLVVLLIVLYAVLKTDKVNKISINPENIEVNEAVRNNETLKGYRNIALFGVDSRDQSLGKGNRSDTIMIASVNLDTGDVKLVSVYRDTYLNLGNDTYNKSNSAYAKGGPEQAINMLNMNLDLNIEDYITIGFTGLEKVIDAVGGVEINILEEEIRHLNNYQISMVGTTTDGKTFVADEGKDYIPITRSGLQTLNGLQATAYCRVRQVGDDFMRAERQREVLSAIMEKAKTASPATLNKIMDEVLPYVSTSLDVNEMLEVLGQITQYNIVGKDGFPFAEYRTTATLGKKGSCVIPVDLNANVVKLHEFLFDTQEYELSDEVQKYSQIIRNDTGK
ncbi:MAG: LCP family protein [Lachnospiraceae bacterium]|nr:LCP family protein [Lachnospiraceae bacterium]MDD7025787.1 LCP family protein [Lachnospiraceae bacterium]MDY5699978.1 LCP family protein [Lachnospiraceae bacterium]